MDQNKKRAERSFRLRTVLEPTGERETYNVWIEGFGYAGCDVIAPSAKAARHAVEEFLFNELTAVSRIESDE